jgi:hypothetical protein
MRLAEGRAMTDTAMVPGRNGDRPAGPAPLIDEQLADQLLGTAQAEASPLARRYSASASAPKQITQQLQRRMSTP